MSPGSPDHSPLVILRDLVDVPLVSRPARQAHLFFRVVSVTDDSVSIASFGLRFGPVFSFRLSFSEFSFGCSVHFRIAFSVPR